MITELISFKENKMLKTTETQLRKIIQEEILRELGEKKDSPDVKNLKRKIESIASSLQGAFKSIDNPDELAQALNFLIDKIVESDGIDKNEIMKALSLATTQQRKK